MPEETPHAVKWALEQAGVKTGDDVDRHTLVDYVRQWFNENNVEYNTFSFDDLAPHMPS